MVKKMTGMSREEVIKLMESSTSSEDWNQNCDRVKEACGGYPGFWYEAIILSGVIEKSHKNWSDRDSVDTKIHISVL